VYRIAYNLSIDALRRSGRGEKVEVDENTLTDEATQHDTWSATSQSPQKATLRGELSAELQRALATLSENHRAILVMREVEGLSYEELSEALGIPKGTVMSRLFHARHKMQAVLKDYLGEDAPEGDEP
jgi:RNA polymerase sigma-70 factor (ECF subfamily)